MPPTKTDDDAMTIMTMMVIRMTIMTVMMTMMVVMTVTAMVARVDRVRAHAGVALEQHCGNHHLEERSQRQCSQAAPEAFKEADRAKMKPGQAAR
jgi:hypothetical protein